MAQVTLTVGGRRYDLACRDGEEARLRMLAGMVDAKAADADRAVGDANQARQLLLAALLLADELSDIRSATPDETEARLTQSLVSLAERVESLAERLERDAPTP